MEEEEEDGNREEEEEEQDEEEEEQQDATDLMRDFNAVDDLGLVDGPYESHQCLEQNIRVHDEAGPEPPWKPFLEKERRVSKN